MTRLTQKIQAQQDREDAKRLGWLLADLVRRAGQVEIKQVEMRREKREYVGIYEALDACMKEHRERNSANA